MRNNWTHISVNSQENARFYTTNMYKWNRWCYKRYVSCTFYINIMNIVYYVYTVYIHMDWWRGSILYINVLENAWEVSGFSSGRETVPVRRRELLCSRRLLRIVTHNIIRGSFFLVPLYYTAQRLFYPFEKKNLMQQLLAANGSTCFFSIWKWRMVLKIEYGLVMNCRRNELELCCWIDFSVNANTYMHWAMNRIWQKSMLGVHSSRALILLLSG